MKPLTLTTAHPLPTDVLLKPTFSPFYVVIFKKNGLSVFCQIMLDSRHVYLSSMQIFHQLCN